MGVVVETVSPGDGEIFAVRGNKLTGKAVELALTEINTCVFRSALHWQAEGGQIV